jgi:hypothetical protein
MKRLKWWESDWTERQRINEAADELNRLHFSQGHTTEQLARLFELDRDQGREIARLQAMVMTLVELLVQKGVVEEPELVNRLEASLDQLQREERAKEEEALGQREVGNPFAIAPRKTGG